MNKLYLLLFSFFFFELRLATVFHSSLELGENRVLTPQSASLLLYNLNAEFEQKRQSVDFRAEQPFCDLDASHTTSLIQSSSGFEQENENKYSCGSKFSYRIIKKVLKSAEDDWWRRQTISHPRPPPKPLVHLWSSDSKNAARERHPSKENKAQDSPHSEKSSQSTFQVAKLNDKVFVESTENTQNKDLSHSHPGCEREAELEKKSDMESAQNDIEMNLDILQSKNDSNEFSVNPTDTIQSINDNSSLSCHRLSIKKSLSQSDLKDLKSKKRGSMHSTRKSSQRGSMKSMKSSIRSLRQLLTAMGQDDLSDYDYLSESYESIETIDQLDNLVLDSIEEGLEVDKATYAKSETQQYLSFNSGDSIQLQSTLQDTHNSDSYAENKTSRSNGENEIKWNCESLVDSAMENSQSNQSDCNSQSVIQIDQAKESNNQVDKQSDMRIPLKIHGSLTDCIQQDICTKSSSFTQFSSIKSVNSLEESNIKSMNFEFTKSSNGSLRKKRNTPQNKRNKIARFSPSPRGFLSTLCFFLKLFIIT